jgi:hypothetical protein
MNTGSFGYKIGLVASMVARLGGIYSSLSLQLKHELAAT